MSIKTIEDVRTEFGDDVVDEALQVLRDAAATGQSRDAAITQIKLMREAGGGPEAALGIALALLLRGIVDYDAIPEDGAPAVLVDMTPDQAFLAIRRGKVPDAQMWLEEAIARGIAQADPAVMNDLLADYIHVCTDKNTEAWKLRAALHLAKDDSNGLAILQDAVTGYLAVLGVTD